MSKYPLSGAFGIDSLDPDKSWKKKQKKDFLSSATTGPNWLYSIFLRRSVAGALTLALLIVLAVGVFVPRTTYASSLSYLALSNTYFHQHSEHDPFELHDEMILLFDPRIVPVYSPQSIEITYTYGNPEACPNYILTTEAAEVTVSYNEDGSFTTQGFKSNGEERFNYTLQPNEDVPILIDPRGLEEESSYTFACTDDSEETIINSFTRKGSALSTLEVSLQDGTLIYLANVRTIAPN